MKNSKNQQLKSLKSRKYRIYGIFNFQTGKIIYVNLDFDKTMLEFELEGYDEEAFDIVSFDILLV